MDDMTWQYGFCHGFVSCLLLATIWSIQLLCFHHGFCALYGFFQKSFRRPNVEESAQNIPQCCEIPSTAYNHRGFVIQLGRSTYMDNHGFWTSRLCLLLLIAGISNGESPFDTTGRFGLSRKLSSKWCVAKSCRIVSVDNWTVTTELFPFVKRPPPASIIAQIDSKLMRLFWHWNHHSLGSD